MLISKRCYLYASIAAIAIMAGSSSLHAQVYVDTDETVPGTHSSPWNIGNTLSIGYTSTGSMMVLGSGKVSNTDGYIGHNAGSAGAVTVTGTGSQWTNYGRLFIGYSGTASLTISDSAMVSAGTLVEIATDATSSGTVKVIGSGSQLVSGGVILVGRFGKGTLTISDGALASGTQATIAAETGSSGSAIEVTGSGSQLILSKELFVGVNGNAHLTISVGGLVSNTIGYIGGNPGSNSIAEVTGTGSQWLNSNEIYVGRMGNGSLTISNGGVVSNVFGFISYETGSSGNVIVTGAGAQWINSNALYVGRSGIGNLTIANGGLVSNLYGYIGTFAGSSGTVIVTGAGSQWINSDNLAVGQFSNGYVNISDGGLVSNAIGYIGSFVSSNSSVEVTGAGSQWINSGTLYVGLSGTGSLTISDGSTVKTTEAHLAEYAGSSGVINIGAEAGIPALAPGSLDTPSLVFGDGDGTLVFNHTDTSGSYHFAAAISGTGQVDHYSGTTIMDGATTYAGPTTLYGGIMVAGNTNVFSPNSDYNVYSGAALDFAGHNQTILSLTNTGIIRMNGSPGTVLTVTDTYTSNGGSILMNTVLGADNSVTDRLVAGSVVMGSGATSLFISNVGGLGALTTGNGIMLVKVQDASNSAADAFQLGNRAAAGAYEYTLHHNGIETDNSDGNWYLRSTMSNSSGGHDGTVEVPNYRPEVPLAASVPPVAIEYGYAMLGTMHERIGDGFAVRPEPVFEERIVRGKNGKRQVIRTEIRQSANNQKWFGGAWGRLIGDRGFRDAGSFERHGPSYNYTFSGLQAGLDIYGRETEAGTDKVGIYFGYGNIDTHVKGAYGGKAGNVDMDAYTIGAYWTHRATQGWYTDAVIQGTWYSADATSVYGQKLTPDGFGFIASLEGGYSFNLGNGLTIEPQAQLAYQTMSFDNISDAYGRFYLDNSDSLRGRLGVRIAKDWDTSGTTSLQSLTTWVRANVWHEFMGNSKTTTTDAYGLNGVTIPSNLGGTWAEIGAGITAQFTDNVSLFATGAYSHSLDNKGREAWNGRLGINVKW
ncbi:autotransporter outer membrane beta-barrel domain-containing protein [Microvirga sp. W0021]|uniref:Autotransporter outer membrane beta-barrel domain-containing protein n=1 Tax=Hohaiivirga grylli TaxID=3133970 RepID=A0ABV0BP67_9HYPH